MFLQTELRIDYHLSPSWNRPVGVDWAGVDELSLRYNFFLGDIIFIVYEVDMSARWGWIPILDFALSLDFIVGSLARSDESAEMFEFTESDSSIHFRRAGDRVVIEASYVEGEAIASYAELRSESRRFFNRVLRDFVRAYPETLGNPFIINKLQSGDSIG